MGFMDSSKTKYLFLIAAIIGITYYFHPKETSTIAMGSNPTRKRKPRLKAKKSVKRALKSLLKRVRVYRNLNTGTLSAQEKTAKGWRVTKHPKKIHLKNVRFLVNQTGRKKVIKDKRKNVHAYIEGELVDTSSTISGKLLTYDPYKTDQFMTKDGKKVYEAEEVSIEADGAIRAKGI